MKEESGGNVVLMASMALNIALVGIIFWLGVHNSRILMNSYVDAAKQRVTLQESILKSLENADLQHVDQIKAQLQFGIDVDQRIIYKLATNVKTK